MKDKVALWFVRIICGGMLLIFLGHYGYLKLFTTNELDLSPDERGALIISLAVWMAYEGVRAAILALIKKRIGK